MSKNKLFAVRIVYNDPRAPRGYRSAPIPLLQYRAPDALWAAWKALRYLDNYSFERHYGIHPRDIYFRVKERNTGLPRGVGVVIVRQPPCNVLTGGLYIAQK